MSRASKVWHIGPFCTQRGRDFFRLAQSGGRDEPVAGRRCCALVARSIGARDYRLAGVQIFREASRKLQALVNLSIVSAPNRRERIAMMLNQRQIDTINRALEDGRHANERYAIRPSCRPFGGAVIPVSLLGTIK